MTRWDSDDPHLDMRARAAAAELEAVQGGAVRLLEMARVKSDAGDVLDALTGYRAAILREPGNAAAHAGAAIEAFEYSLLAPHAEARRLRISIARDHASRAIALDPASARAHSALARVLPEWSRVSRGAGRRAAIQAILEAYAHARHAIALDPGDADAHEFVAARAVEWWSVGSFMRAASRVLLGARELDATPLPEALAHARTAVALDPRCLRHRYTLARAFRAVGNPAGAQEHLDVIIESRPLRPSEVAVQRAVAARR